MKPIVQLLKGPTTSSEYPIWDLNVYENRLRTFKGLWKCNFFLPSQMAQAGFAFFGYGDNVQCVSCEVVVKNWQPEDDPITVHRRVSPQCTFLNENQGKLLIIMLHKIIVIVFIFNVPF